MFSQRNPVFPLNERNAFWLVFALVTVVLVGSSLGIVTWIAVQLTAIEEPPVVTAGYVNYDASGDHILPSSNEAMANYIAEFPEPQNVQILEGWSTAQISQYMVSQMSGGLKVDCSYCHVLTEANGYNFAAEGNPNKDTARTMMLMAADINQNFIAQLPPTVNQEIGNIQVTCATCHNGAPRFDTYPAEAIVTLPRNFQLPLELEYPGGLVVTGREDKSLGDVDLNQQVMYHMNTSLGVGCTFCHNARYFPSYEVENKTYAIIMLQMTQHLEQNYLEAMNNQVPSCYTCHQGAQVPPGAARDITFVPPQLSSDPQQ